MTGTGVSHSGLAGQGALIWRVIVGLILRETKTRFGRHRLGYVWALIEPAVFIVLFTGTRAFLSSRVPFGESILLFMVPGLLVVRIFQGIASKMLPAISANMALLSYPPVKPIDVIFARYLLELLTMYALLTIFFVLMDWVADTEVILYYGRFASAVGALSVLCLGFGAFNAVFTVLWPTWERIWGFTGFPVMILSGVFFLPRSMSPNFQRIIEWNPVLHCVEWMRTATYLHYYPLLDRAYPVFFGLVLLALALGAERLFRHRILSA